MSIHAGIAAAVLSKSIQVKLSTEAKMRIRNKLGFFLGV